MVISELDEIAWLFNIRGEGASMLLFCASITVLILEPA